MEGKTKRNGSTSITDVQQIRRYLGQADPHRVAELADQWAGDVGGDAGLAAVEGLVPAADQRTQRAGRLLGPVLAGVDLSSVLQVAKDVRAADLVTADAGEGPCCRRRCSGRAPPPR